MAQAKTATGLGTYGGIKLLDDGPVDPDEIERNEPKRFRPPDVMTELLTKALDDPGPGIIDAQFTISKPGLRDQDITFDRNYPKVRVLVKYFTNRINVNEGQTQDDAMLADLATHKAFALDRGYSFLAVIDGKVERDDLERVKVEVKARQHVVDATV